MNDIKMVFSYAERCRFAEPLSAKPFRFSEMAKPRSAGNVSRSTARSVNTPSGVGIRREVTVGATRRIGR